MTQCSSCAGKSELFICPRCVEELRAQLHSLAHGPEVNDRPTAGLLDALADVALKRTCMGTGSGHRKKGDEMPGPFEPDTGKMVKDKKTGEDTDEVILTPQGRASLLMDQARNSLTTIVRDMCEHRGIDVVPVIRTETSELAMWLARNVNALACDEAAGQWRAEVDSMVRAIERLIDRPTKYELLGFCSTELDKGACGEKLHAAEDAIEVRCRKCHTVRRCDIVRRMAQSEVRRELITWQQVLDANKLQAEGWRVSERTLRHWRSTGTLKIHRYLRPDGHTVINRHSDGDQPLYKWDDVERLRTRTPRERQRTRAGR